MTANIKTHAPFIALALITITLSSWGLFRLLVDFAACPWWLAVGAVGAVDLFAVSCGKQAVDVAADGDSPAFWNAAMLLITGVAAWLQFAHTQLAGWPLAVGVMMTVLPIATVLLFEGRLRRSARLQGRARGAVAPPRRRVPLLVWARFPVEAWRANSEAIWAQGHLDPVKAAPRKPRPVKAIEPAPNEEARNGHDRPQTVAAAVRVKPDKDAVAAAIRDAKALHGTDLEAVLEAANKVYPVSRETVRTNLRRERARMMNGHAHV